MLIVEGPDGSGKTSLVKKLSVDLGIPVSRKAISSQATEMTNVRRWVDTSLDAGWHPTIYDRHGLISEGIYGPTWNGKLREPYDDPQWLQGALGRFAGIMPTVIVCLPPVEEVVKNIRADETNASLYGRVASEDLTGAQDSRTPKKIGQIYYQYQWYVAKHLNVFTYDYTRDRYETVLQYCKTVIDTRGDTDDRLL